MKEFKDATSEYENHVAKFNKYVEQIRAIAKQKYPDALKELGERRGFDVEMLDKLSVFYVGDMRELVLPQFIDNLKEFGVVSETNGRPIFEDRYVFPIKDCFGNVINLVGYTWKSDVRYVYGTAKYYERHIDMYGMEFMAYIFKVGWCILVEGITDKIALNNVGVYNVLASCGTANSPCRMELLSRLEYGVAFIYDRDDAGWECRKHWIVPRYIEVNISNGDKDIDQYLRNKDNIENMIASIKVMQETFESGSSSAWSIERPSVMQMYLY